MRRQVLVVILGLGLVAATLGWWWPRSGIRTRAATKAESAATTAVAGRVVRRRAGGLDVTFLVTGDTHLGWGLVEASTADSSHEPAPLETVLKRMLSDIRRLPGTQYPKALGGVVAVPRGLLVAGDLTEDGKPEQWSAFARWFGLDGQQRQPLLPVYETLGNHDEHQGEVVARKIRERHGAEYYSWNWGDLHLVSLGIAPDGRVLDWLEKDLEKVGPELPVVLFLHYPLAGPYSDTWFSRHGYRDRLARVLSGYQVVGVFHGHFHATGAYRWKGWNVYSVGSPKDEWRAFAVVHVTDQKWSVASWNYDFHGWWWWHQKGINGAVVPEVLEMDGPLDFEYAPVLEPRP